ncbi:MAG: branched-chain amino acid ABC transporter substrate-binding protein [Chloroflexi bacterium]|nr:branched-chain amino acid ABC transporter substrate-binding protein [Chloroflexota bacterium]
MAIVAMAAVFAAACGGDDDDGGSTAGFSDAGYKTAGLDKARVVTIDSGAAIKIGISSALSGDVKGLGVPIADSAEVAGDGVTIKGFKIEWVREDDLCTPEGGPAAADRLIKAKIVAAVGPICSGGTRASLAAFDKEGITHISPSATSGDLTSPTRAEGPYVTFFRVPVLNADEAAAQAKFIRETLKLKKAFVVNDTDDYGKDLAASFQTSFKAQGGEIVGTPEGYEKKTTDFKAIITKIKAAKPDVVYLAGFYAEATPFLQQLRADPDTKALVFMGGDGVKNDELLTGAKDAAEGAYLALPGGQGSQFAAYKSKYAAKYKGDAETVTFGAEAYDAATAILKALEKVAVEKSGKLEIDLKKLNEEIKKSNFEGASGVIKFESNGNRAGAIVRFFQVKGGKYVELPAK